MSPVRSAPMPRGSLYRVGHLPDPLAWPPWELIGNGRFDDPQGEFRVLYVGQRRACFIETLAVFRPSLEAIARMRAVVGTDEALPRAVVPADWYRKRAVGQLQLLRGQRWLDLRSPASREALRVEMAGTLIGAGLKDLDLGEIMGSQRGVTQSVARWAYDHGFSGIAYASRFNESMTLWAVFEGAGFQRADLPHPLSPDDPDLIAAARFFHLAI